MPPSLVSGQIAINEADGKLFYRNGSGVVTQLATGGGGGGTELFPYANTASFPGTGATTALYLSIASGRVYQWNGSVYSEVGPVGGGGSLSATVTIPASGDQYWSNTQLLLRGDTAVDSSSYARTVTAYGGATVSTSQKKFGGGALSFAAVGDYYLVPSSADLSFDTGDFTMEAWVRPTAFPVENGGAYISSFLTRQAPGGHGWRFELRGTSSSFTHLSFTGMSDNGAGEQTVMVSYSFSLNQWYHVAASRVGGVIYLFVDGVLQNTGGTSFGIFIQNASSDVRVGSLNFDVTYKFQFFGQIDDARITKGTGRYAATFTPPTEAYGTGEYVAAQTLPVVGTGSIGSGLSWSSVPASATATGTAGQIAYDGSYLYVATGSNAWERSALSPWVTDPYFSSVSLLLHMSGSNGSPTFTDSSSAARTVTPSGSAAISTAQSKFGGSSGYFNMSADYLELANNAAFDFAGDFTIETWFYASAASGDNYYPIFHNSLLFYAANTGSNAGRVMVFDGSANVVDTGASGNVFSLNTWTHLAWVRSSGVITIYVDGISKASATVSGSISSGNPNRIGRFGSVSFSGATAYIDDLRITKGVARTITVPTAAYPDE